MDSYHVSNLGAYAVAVIPDLDGLVHLTAESVKEGRWEASTEWDDEGAEMLARHNVKETELAERELSRWRGDPDPDEEATVLSIGDEYLPRLARRVRDGDTLSEAERMVYRAWLEDQLDRMEAER